MFADTAEVTIKAGDGGNGAVSFRHEKYVDRGGPDGGDAGNGGKVIFVASTNTNTLSDFRHKQELQAANGQDGSKQKKHGRTAPDLLVTVPVGTQVYRDGRLIADLTADGQQSVIAQGGKGGFGNAHFISSIRQAPKVAEVGEKGEAFTAKLELKLLADVGLIGFPNAGKSTLLSVISNARPEIADYPFTTLKPNLGVAPVDDDALLVADIPGLIEGAAEGKGLGDDFLRHIERTSVLLHLIDAYESDPAKAYQTVNQELTAYNKQLARRPQIVVLTKIEGLDNELVMSQLQQLQVVVPPGTPLFAISAQAHQGLQPLLRAAHAAVVAARQAAEAMSKEDGKVVIGLSDEAKQNSWKVTYDGGRYVVTGHKIEKFAARTNFASEPGLRRLRDIMRKMGIMHELERKGITVDDTVVIGTMGDYKLPYQH